MARASIRQVAQAAGVSTMTVSRVLRGQGGSQFEEQVLLAVRELDYVPVRSAVQNRHVKTQVLGVLLDDEFSFDSPIGRQTFDGLRRAAFARGYDLLLFHPQHQQPLEKQKIPFLDRRCDGFIFVVPVENAEILDLLVEHEFPAVSCYSTDVPTGIAWVVPDNQGAIREAVQLLKARGHRRIAFCGAGRRHSDARERSDAFEREMNACGLRPVVLDVPGELLDTQGAMCDALVSLLQQDVSAVLCHNDERALALWDAANERGVCVPEELSLVGIDDLPQAAKRGLTTFANPFFNIGFRAAQSLIAVLEGEVDAKCQRLPLTLVERDSVASPKSSDVLIRPGL